jgi:hypothetical protein
MVSLAQFHASAKRNSALQQVLVSRDKELERIDEQAPASGSIPAPEYFLFRFTSCTKK